MLVRRWRGVPLPPLEHRMLPRRLRFLVATLALALGLGVASAQPTGAADPPMRIKVVGGLADVSQYVRFEEPFWRRRITELTNGRIVAEIAPFDRSGIRGNEMLQLMRLGVAPFGTALLALGSADEPEFNAVDLPGLSPDMDTLRRNVQAYRPHLERLLRERYGIELLGIYTYPAQVLFCARPFTGLSDLAGRRVRTSSVGQSELVQSLGATPVVTPFAEIVSAMRAGTVECAITGTLSGHAIGLYQVTSHVHTMALGWGLSIFGANIAAWASLPADLRETIRAGITALENEIWQAADRETGEGLACNANLPICSHARRGNMTIVQAGAADEALRRRLITEVVLPRWVERCGPDCVEGWNTYLAPVTGIQAKAD
jgi:TRAP-type C4-dicarboxylate transport system substrate-binding protein